MIFGNTIPMSQKALDYLWKKQEITADNIANVDTPNYRKKHISFEETFRKKLQGASEAKNPEIMRRAIQSSRYQIYERSDTARIDGNNVNMDVETTTLARTTMHYQYLLQSVNSDFTRLKSVIKGQ